MRFGVLGPLAVWTDEGAAVRVPELKTRALLADLLVHRGRPVSVDQLVDDLWGGGTARLPRNPVGTLQTRVSQLRRALDAAEPGGRGLLVSQAPGYLLRAAPEAVDGDRFRALAERARATEDPRARAALLADALALWRGPAYADFADEEFARPDAARLEDERLAVQEEYAEVRLELGEHAALAGELSEAVERHPLRERLRAAHLRALYRAGRQSEALAGFEDLRHRLAEELGVDPSPELAALHRAILTQDPLLDAPRTAVRAAAAPPREIPTNLPAPLSDLVGRDAAVAEVRALLDGSRLVTLTGPGGVGKTRLALATARTLTGANADGRFPDGVWLVELSGLDRASGATPADAIAMVLGVRDDDAPAAATARRTPVELLAGALAARRLLLVLDNCEHVVDQVAVQVAALLRAAPGVCVLATSRESLALSGERLWPVPPLGEADAVRLFTARAAAAVPGFAPGPDDTATIAAVCRRLDGIPLAVELAATRVRALGVAGLADRLDDRFRLLTSGNRDAPARQRTLRAMIDWSWEPLAGDERAVLRRLAVHADGCTLRAAEEVCSEDGLDVLGVLARLVDRSLVVRADGPGGAPPLPAAGVGQGVLRGAAGRGGRVRGDPCPVRPAPRRARRARRAAPLRARPAEVAGDPGRRGGQPARRPGGRRAPRSRGGRAAPGRRAGLALVPARTADRGAAVARSGAGRRGRAAGGAREGGGLAGRFRAAHRHRGGRRGGGVARGRRRSGRAGLGALVPRLRPPRLRRPRSDR